MWDPFACKLWESLWRTQGSRVPLNIIPPNVISPNQFPSQSHSTSNLSVFWQPTEIKASIPNDPTNTFHFYPYYFLQKSHKIPMQQDGTKLLKHLLSSSLIFLASLRHMRNCTVGISVPGRVKPVKGLFLFLQGQLIIVTPPSSSLDSWAHCPLNLRVLCIWVQINSP